MKGHKKVKDIFIDEKIPLQFRDHWPVVEDSQGTILWLPGLKNLLMNCIHISPDMLFYTISKRKLLGGK